MREENQLNSRKLFVIFNSAISEELQHHSQIVKSTISNGTLNAISRNELLALQFVFQL
jgi:hypothetical protein